MAEITYYVALPFLSGDDGPTPGEAVECGSATAAIKRAEALSKTFGHVGAVAFRRSGDPMLGDFGDATIIGSFGEVSGDLFEL